MPITVQSTDGGLGFIMKGEGVVTGQEIFDGVVERFSSEAKIRKYVYGMSDYTEVQRINMSNAEVILVAEKDKQVATINRSLVIAIAAPQDIIFGLSRMFEAYAQETGWDINVFRTRQEAQKWILEKLKANNTPTTKINFKEDG